MELSTDLSFEDLTQLNTGVSLSPQEESIEYDSKKVIDFLKNNTDEVEEIMSESFS